MRRPDQPAGVTADSSVTERASAWSPFRHRLFAAMWGAQFVSNVGSWMQTVAAQWLMLSLTTSATYVALVQTAAGLPVVLFAILAGTIGDLADRRRFLLGAQTFMLLAAGALGGLAIAGLVTPWVLLALLFAVGTGQALTAPTWQTLQPELVSPAERQQAISLGSVNQNLARAVGPAIGGALLAVTSAGTVFLVNAASFAAVIGVIWAWHSTRPPDALPREHVGEAVRAGGRYVAASPVLRVVLARAALFIFFASAIWALLPLTAQSVLHLGSGGYGLLLGSVGIGAVVGAASRAGLSTTLTIAATGLALGPLLALVWRFHPLPPEDLLPGGDWPAPQLASDQAPDGPVLVSVEYWARPGLVDELMTALQDTRFSRRRTGATSWRAWSDAANRARVLEQFVVASWDEHLRQHERVTKRDQKRLDRLREMTDPAHPVTVTHWLANSHAGRVP
jgi:MFS family permease